MASRDFLKHVVSTSETVGSGLGDEYYNPSSNKMFKRLAVNGTSVQWVEQQQSIAIQAAGTLVAAGARTINFSGATITYNSTTDTISVQSSGIPGGANTNIQFNSSGAFAGSSNLTWDGSLLNVTGRIETNGSRVVDYKNTTAQWAMSGGGLVTWTGASILWNTRVICIPVENSEMGSSGHFDITCPTSGTVVYYNNLNVTTTLTATAAGIPLGAWEALYYEVTEGMSSAFDQTRFRVVNYQNTTWRPSTGWLLVAAVNGDGNNVGHIKWLPGQVNLPTTGATVTYNTGTGISSWAVGTGTVTSVSVVSANGFAGTVATASSTPAITISTSISGVLKGNGTAISAAVAGTDYQTAQSVTGIVKSSGTTRSAAVAGTDYQAAVSATGILKSSGVSGNVSAAVAGTDYVAPAGTFFIGTTSIAHNRASASLSMTGINIDGSAGSATTAGVGTTVTTTASTANSNFKIAMLNTTGVATGNFGLLLDSSAAGDFTYNPSTNALTVGIIYSGTYNQIVSQNNASTAAGFQELFRIASSNLTTSGTFALSATRGGFVHGSNFAWTSTHNATGQGTLIMLSSGSYSNIDIALDVNVNGDVIISANWGAAQTYGITVNVQIGGVISFATVGTAWTAPNTGYTRRVSFTTFGNGTRIDQLAATSLGVGTNPNGTIGDIKAANIVYSNSYYDLNGGSAITIGAGGGTILLRTVGSISFQTSTTALGTESMRIDANNNVIVNIGYMIQSTATGLTAAGTTQGTALLLARQINDVTVVAASSGVRLPVAVAGMRVIVRNSSVTNLNVYPNTGAQIQSLGANVAMTLVAATMLEYVAVSATQWYLMNNVYA